MTQPFLNMLGWLGLYIINCIVRYEFEITVLYGFVMCLRIQQSPDFRKKMIMAKKYVTELRPT
jgi:hypothetical protein